MKVLITGGAGYIGSTICSALEDQGYTPIVLDSLINGRREFVKNRVFYEGDICDERLLTRIFNENKDIECTIHCAALIVVPESMEKPYEYYNENVVKSLKFFNCLKKLGCDKIVFSSSASIYDDVEGFMVSESSNKRPRSPYARTKFIMEMILEDFCYAYNMKGIALRYFNVIGADPSMRSGMYQQNPTHVLGKLVRVAKGDDEIFRITGSKWPTRDGSGIRDYIHVWDIANAHVCAVKNMDGAFERLGRDTLFIPINLGTGDGVTVKELVRAFEKVYTDKPVNVVETDPRLGDVAGAYANADLAYKLIDWKAELSIEEGIKHALDWDGIRINALTY